MLTCKFSNEDHASMVDWSNWCMSNWCVSNRRMSNWCWSNRCRSNWCWSNWCRFVAIVVWVVVVVVGVAIVTIWIAIVTMVWVTMVIGVVRVQVSIDVPILWPLGGLR